MVVRGKKPERFFIEARRIVSGSRTMKFSDKSFRQTRCTFTQSSIRAPALFAFLDGNSFVIVGNRRSLCRSKYQRISRRTRDARAGWIGGVLIVRNIVPPWGSFLFPPFEPSHPPRTAPKVDRSVPSASLRVVRACEFDFTRFLSIGCHV